MKFASKSQGRPRTMSLMRWSALWRKFFLAKHSKKFKKDSVMSTVVCCTIARSASLLGLPILIIFVCWSSKHFLLNVLQIEKFTDSEENKIEYTELFQAYTIIIEKSLDLELKAKIPVSFIGAWNAKLTTPIQSSEIISIFIIISGFQHDEIWRASRGQKRFVRAICNADECTCDRCILHLKWILWICLNTSKDIFKLHSHSFLRMSSHSFIFQTRLILKYLTC